MIFTNCFLLCFYVPQLQFIYFRRPISFYFRFYSFMCHAFDVIFYLHKGLWSKA